MDTATKTRIDASKTASNRVVQKTAEEIYIPPEKRQQRTIDDLRFILTQNAVSIV